MTGNARLNIMPAPMRTIRKLPPFSVPGAILAVSLASAACDDPVTVVEVQPKMELDQTVLDFGNVQIGTAVTKTFFIKNTGDGNLSLPVEPLTQQAPLDAAFTFAIDGERRVVVPNGSLTVTVTFQPDAVGERQSALEVKSSDANVAPITVQLKGTGVTTTLQVDPEVLSFGNVVINTTKSLTVSLTNSSDVDATVTLTTGQNVKLCTSNTVDPSTYCVNLQGTNLTPEGTFSLRAGQVAQLEVRFTPVIAGTTERGDVALRACSSSACERQIRLSGVGIEQGFRCTPANLDYGQVNPGSCLTQTVACENIANERVTVLGANLVTSGGNPSSPDFAVEAISPISLESGQSVEVDATYCPLTLGEDTGTMAIETDNRDARLKFLYVPLRGTGGGPDIEVFPAQLNFGLVSLIAPSRRTVLIANAGQDPLNVRNILVDTAGTGAFTVSGVSSGVIPAGQSLSVTVEFQPQVEGPIESELVIQSDDQDEGEVRVRLIGEGIMLPPCSFEVAPAQLNFGVVERGRVSSRAFEIRNVGSNVCLVTAARLQPGTDPEFSMPDGDVSSLMVPAGAATTIRVDFAPTMSNSSNGGVEFSISSNTNPYNTVTLAGTGADATLLIVPNELDFGTIGVPCSARARTVTIYNTGSSPAVIDAIGLASPANPAFTIAALPSPLPGSPLTLAPGASTSFDVTFRAEAVSSYAGAVEINGTFAGNPVTYVVSLLGIGSNDARQVDEFEQLGKPKVDILFIVDNSGSMFEEQTALSSNFAAFIQFAEAQGIEYQLAVTTTDVDGGEDGRFVPLSGNPADRIVTPQTQPDPETVFVNNVNVGTNGSADEQGLEAAYLALSNPLIFGHNAGFLRPDAVLSVIFVSDEEDSSPNTVPFYINFLLSIKGFRNTNLFTASAIVGDTGGGCNGAGGNAGAGERYIEVANRTGGVFQSICTSDWSRSLEDLSTTAFGFKSRFFLDNQPVIPTIVVTLDGVVIPATSPEGTVNWSYDYGTNSVNFSPFATPEPGAQIRVEYVAECL